MSRLINLTYHINKEESSIKFDPNNKLAVLKNLIQMTQRVNIDDHEILYGNRILSFKDNKSLKEIIGRDINPIFHIIKIPKEYNDNKRVNKSIIPIKNQTCVVCIENAPSRAEIYTILNKYLEIKNNKQEFTAENKGSRIDITFKNPDIAYEFLKQINVEKINNPLYSKVKTNMILGDNVKIVGISNGENNKFFSQNILATPRNDLKNIPINNMIISPKNEIKNISNINVNSISLNNNKNQKIKHRNLSNSSNKIEFSMVENILDKSFSLDDSHGNRDRTDSKKKISNKRNDRFKLVNMATNMKEIDDENFKKRVLNNYYKNSATLRTGSPYISDDQIHFQEYIKNKKKWLNEKGLLPVINKPKPNFIPNGINYEYPYGKPIYEYKFREI